MSPRLPPITPDIEKYLAAACGRLRSLYQLLMSPHLPPILTDAMLSGTGDDKSVMGNNTVYSPTGNVTECGMSLVAWQAQGNDLGTTAHAYADGDLPGLAISWAREKIFRRN